MTRIYEILDKINICFLYSISLAWYSYIKNVWDKWHEINKIKSKNYK